MSDINKATFRFRPTPAQVLRSRFHLEQQLSAPGSLSGYQADRLQMGLSGPSGNGARSNGQDTLRAKLGDLLLLCRGLTPEEEKVCRLKYGTQGQIETYRRHRRPCDMQQGDGEEVIAVKTEYDGYVEVEGKRSRYPVREQIAASAGMTARQVKSRLSSAHSKIADAIKTSGQA